MKGFDPIPRLWWCLMLSAFILVLSGETSGFGDEERAIEKARRYYEEGRFDEALEFAKEAEEKMPGDPGAWLLTGKIYLAQAAGIERYTGFAGFFRRDLLGEAEESFRKALALEPDNRECGEHLAFTLMLLKNIPAAQDRAEKVLAAHPDDAYCLYLLGEIKLLEEDPQGAVGFFEQSLSIDDQSEPTRAGLVRALTAAKRFAEAEEALLTLAGHLPDLPDLVQLACCIYEPSGLYGKAKKLFERILQIAPAREDVAFQLGRAEFLNGDLEASKNRFETLLSSDPDHEGSLYYLGALLVREGNLERGRDLLLQCVAKEGGFFSPAITQLHFVALRLAKLDRYEESLSLFDRLVALKAADGVILSDRALLLSHWGRTDEADAAYRDLMAFDPWDSSSVNNFALHLLGTGRTAEGLKMLEKAISIDGNADALENYGSYYYYILDEPGRAMPYFDEVLQKDPERTKSLVLRELLKIGGVAAPD